MEASDLPAPQMLTRGSGADSENNGVHSCVHTVTVRDVTETGTPGEGSASLQHGELCELPSSGLDPPFTEL